ncbi:hypothetical protein LPJ59_004541 [Coemansia sp. RSA 2399]|nr:hypothetical protein LPJ59_004541 [Coemansia sp. RSA 2399]KAJ1898632.1 hypothetical protein LPJ81_004296 [Coemansia sp. IMI 209127]
MRLTIIAQVLLAATAMAAPAVFRRDKDGAVAAFNAIQGSTSNSALSANVGTFFSNLNGIADPSDVQLADKQVTDQISANSLNKVPTSLTAAWVASTLVHFIQ